MTKLLLAFRWWKTEYGRAGKIFPGKDVNRIGKLAATPVEKDWRDGEKSVPGLSVVNIARSRAKLFLRIFSSGLPHVHRTNVQVILKEIIKFKYLFLEWKDVTACKIKNWPMGEVSQELVFPNSTAIERFEVCYDISSEVKGIICSSRKCSL